ncbi:MAG: tail fiber domain-containing protein [Chitinophagaceae bacterium]|nr:tail fiber domain-containing protein [Chitinophagaceae bacterium]
MPGVGGTGNLGIGTTTPATKLTVQTLNGNYGISHTDGSIIMATYIGNGFGWIGTRSNHPLAFFSNNSASPQMTLLANGNVGVGTTTPATKFTIRTPNNSDGFSHETDGGIILKDVVGGISAAMGTYSNHIFRLVANSVAVINIEPSGSVGVGISGAVNKLQVGSMGATGFNGNDIAIGNGTHATGFSQSNAAATFVSTTDIVFLPRGNGHGRIGINTNTPRAPLDVSDYTTVAKDPSATGFYGYLNFAGVTGTSAAPTTIGNVSIYSSGRVYADEFDAFSDGRIKDIAGISNTVKDLEIINSLHITDYTMKDKVKYGAKPYKKVIAQEVEKVYPQVISKHTDFIPNVYQLTYKIEKKNNGYLLSFPNKHNISNTAKKLRVLLSGTEAMQEVEIVAIPSDTQVIITAPDIKSDKVFVYGEEVDDFRTVDYEGLTTLNISATQELSRLLKEQEKNNEMQNKKIAAMEAAMELLKNNAVIPSVAGK